MMTNPNQIQVPTIPASFGTFQSKSITSYDMEVIEVTGKIKSQYVRSQWFPSKTEAHRYLQTLTKGTIWRSQATVKNGYVITGKREFVAGK
jgi:predicted FMN-binding regulatory protein PaiB